MPTRLAAVLALSAGLPLCLGACRSVVPTPDEPAWIVSPSAASRAELEAAIRELIGGREVLLSDDALTSSHVLTLEPSAQGRLEGRALGRDLGVPERFELVLRGRRCFLVHVASGERVRLLESRCTLARG